MYYYMRSLAASNPILTAKESLMSLFEETKRKVSKRAHGPILPKRIRVLWASLTDYQLAPAKNRY